MPKAIALMSGGLDSVLAARVVQDLGVVVRGVVFDSGFFTLERPGIPPDSAEHPLLQRVAAVAAPAGIALERVDVSEAYLRMLLNPPHGYGASVNPCIDCKILFLRRAREMLAAWGGDFVITGEVLGQRPMSQNAQALKIIERESGCEGILLRPLSAQCLPPTRPEREGLVPRERLYGFQGRGRKPQLALAARLGITVFGQPAGGCVLTDAGFERRFRDWRKYAGPETVPTFEQMALLRLGRHFRLPQGGKVIVGRNAVENSWLQRYRGALPMVRASHHPGPIALVEENGDPQARRFASRAVARYADAEAGQDVVVAWEEAGGTLEESVAPLTDEELVAARL